MRAGSTWRAVGSALVMTAVGVLGGGALHRRIRKSETAQLGAAAALSVVGAPVSWLGGVPVSAVVAGVLAWSSIFVASALLVRATFARSARSPGRRPLALSVSALTLVVAMGILLAASGQWPESSACAVASVGCAALSCVRFRTKQLKHLGLALAAILLGATLAFAL